MSTSASNPKRIGVLGTGQLGLMLGQAGAKLGAACHFFGPDADPPAARAGQHTCAPFDDLAALTAFAKSCDVITWEWENVPTAAVAHVAAIAPVAPPTQALATAQDRLLEKQLFTRLGIATPQYVAVDDEDTLRQAVAALGLPCVLKTRRGGYDGKGQAVLRREEELPNAWRDLGLAPGGLIAEAFVPFERELSVIEVRSHDGTAAAYPIVENHHAGGILRTSIAPAAHVPDAAAQQARAAARAVGDALNYVGVFALELFAVRQGSGLTILANEIAPRVHNSGHWTIEGSHTSQFENHLRAILRMPPGLCDMHRAATHAGMINLIGTAPDPAMLARIPGVHVHLYGKTPRIGRKLGHVTVTADTAAERDALVQRVQRLI